MLVLGPITPSEVLDLPLYAALTNYGYEYVLPSKMRSFMANRNLVPVSYTRKVLQVENNHAQTYLQHQVARRVAADLEVLPGHEIHIDPALLFFILKVRRETILEDTTAALEHATPEDLRRQLKVVFEGEQGVDEGGLAREFFRLLSAKVSPLIVDFLIELWPKVPGFCGSTKPLHANRPENFGWQVLFLVLSCTTICLALTYVFRQQYSRRSKRSR